MALNSLAGAGATDEDGAGKGLATLTNGPVAIEVRGIEKAFQIPTHRISRLKERLVNPFALQEYRRLEALNDVSFDVHQGEFFGIVGRNGSGKSTLLKIMASIYGTDAGTVRMRGSVAPFIELGVGFDMELSGRENVVLNAVMMGLTPREARRRIDAVFEFAELGEFVDMKLKNYSSGMLVRLAFSVMVQADPDILLIDEVLAVGDAAFQQKCADVFHQMRKRGKTVVLVTHDMRAVEEYCHRAMLLSNGSVVQTGDPAEVARRYFRLNFEQHTEQTNRAKVSDGDGGEVRLLDIWLEDADGERVTSVEQGQRIGLRALIEAQLTVPGALFGFILLNADEVAVHEFVGPLSQGERAEADELAAGRRATIRVDFDNRLVPGRYYIHFGVARNRNRSDVALHVPHVLGFVVYGDQKSGAIVAIDHEMEVETSEAQLG